MSTENKDLTVQKPAQPSPTEPEFTVEVVDDTPEQDRGKARAEPLKDAPPGLIPSDEELAQYSASVQKRFKQMTYEFHEQRRQKEARERERDEATGYAQRLYQEVQRLRGTVATGEKSLVEQAKGRVEAEIAAAREKFRKAHEAGDTEALVKAQEEMAALQARKQTVENYQPQYQQPAQDQQIRQPAQQQVPAVDPKAKEWADKNSWFQTNKRMTAFAFGVHDELVTEKGIDPRKDPDKYYAELDKAMREQFPAYEAWNGDDDTTVVVQQPKPRQQAATVVAPAGRINVSKDGRKVSLTASQAAIAKRLGLTNEQYALEALKVAKEQ